MKYKEDFKFNGIEYRLWLDGIFNVVRGTEDELAMFLEAVKTVSSDDLFIIKDADKHLSRNDILRLQSTSHTFLVTCKDESLFWGTDWYVTVLQRCGDHVEVVNLLTYNRKVEYSIDPFNISMKYDMPYEVSEFLVRYADEQNLKEDLDDTMKAFMLIDKCYFYKNELARRRYSSVDSFYSDVVPETFKERNEYKVVSSSMDFIDFENSWSKA